MSAVTYFVAMPFVRTEEGDLVPGEAQECPSAVGAEAAARRFARNPAYKGAVAFSRSGDPNVGGFEDAKVLLAVGDVLTMDDLVNAAASM